MGKAMSFLRLKCAELFTPEAIGQNLSIERQPWTRTQLGSERVIPANDSWANAVD